MITREKAMFSIIEAGAHYHEVDMGHDGFINGFSCEPSNGSRKDEIIAGKIVLYSSRKQAAEAAINKIMNQSVKQQPQSVIAEIIARDAHAGQKRRDGVTPYIEHPESVARMFVDENRKAIAWLHDVLEDTDVTVQYLLQEGVNPEIVHVVEILTNREKDPDRYRAYIAKVASNPIARAVKVADILHNLSSDPTKNQVRKYASALSILLTDAVRVRFDGPESLAIHQKTITK